MKGRGGRRRFKKVGGEVEGEGWGEGSCSGRGATSWPQAYVP